MCGRFTLWNTADMAEHYGLEELPEALSPDYNIAPGKKILAVSGDENGPELNRYTWGFVPSWAKDIKKVPRSINARSETVQNKALFRSAIKKRRCLIPANGFFEWKLMGKTKQPYLIAFENMGLFSMGGIWEYRKSPGEEDICSCTILTVEANETIAEIHDRMPLILDPADYHAWLSKETDPADIVELFKSLKTGKTIITPVDIRVGNPRYNNAGCLVPVPVPGTLF